MRPGNLIRYRCFPKHEPLMGMYISSRKTKWDANYRFHIVLLTSGDVVEFAMNDSKISERVEILE